MARWQPTSGTPQGAVILPILANLYLHPLEVLMEQGGWRMVRYADDFVILCRTPEEAQAALSQVQTWVTANGLESRVRENRQHGSEGGEGESSSRPLSTSFSFAVARYVRILRLRPNTPSSFPRNRLCENPHGLESGNDDLGSGEIYPFSDAVLQHMYIP